MRILRLYAPSLIGDHTLCYIHSTAEGDSCINEVPIRITLAYPGQDLNADEFADAMTIVLPADAE
jgi:molybdopterin adenylyltransferase